MATKRRIYQPINREKYDGRYPIVLKSSWEEFFAQFCDLNEGCVSWAYEPWRIPYRDPIADRQTVYIPDFLITFRRRDGGLKTLLVEIKPAHEQLIEHARSPKDALAIARNEAKWDAARFWCSRRNDVEFVVLTEVNLFGQEIKPRKRKIRRYGERRVRKT